MHRTGRTTSTPNTRDKKSSSSVIPNGVGCIEQREMHRTVRARRTTVHIAPLNAPYVRREAAHQLDEAVEQTSYGEIPDARYFAKGVEHLTGISAPSKSIRDLFRTRPSGRKGWEYVSENRTGNRSVGTDRVSQINADKENEVADLMASRGYKVRQLQPGDLSANDRAKYGIPSRNPDYIIEDRVFDLSRDRSGDLNGIWDDLANKSGHVGGNKQADHVILDLRESGATRAQVAAHLRENPIPGLKEVLVLKLGPDGQMRIGKAL